MNNLKKTGIMGLLGLILVACGVKQKDEVKETKVEMATDSVEIKLGGETAKIAIADLARELKALETDVEKGILSKKDAEKTVLYASEHIVTQMDAVIVCNSPFVTEEALQKIVLVAEEHPVYLGNVYAAIFNCKLVDIEDMAYSKRPIVVWEAVKRAETEKTLLNAIDNLEKRTVCAGAVYDEMFKSKAKTPSVLRFLSKSNWPIVVVEAMKDPMTEDNDICDALEWARGSKNPEFRQMFYSVVKKRPNLSAKVAMKLANITADVRNLQNVSLGKDSVKVEEKIK